VSAIRSGDSAADVRPACPFLFVGRHTAGPVDVNLPSVSLPFPTKGSTRLMTLLTKSLGRIVPTDRLSPFSFLLSPLTPASTGAACFCR